MKTSTIKLIWPENVRYSPWEMVMTENLVEVFAYEKQNFEIGNLTIQEISFTPKEITIIVRNDHARVGEMCKHIVNQLFAHETNGSYRQMENGYHRITICRETL